MGIRKKRGQITVFMIIGVMLLVAVIIYLFFFYKTTEVREGMQLPTEVKPVKEYVDACIEKTAEQGFTLLGQQGGYIEVPLEITSSPTAYLAISPNKVIILPYWHYEGQSRVPSIDTMQLQLAKYIKENIGPCIDNLSAFDYLFDIKTGDNYDVKVTIGEDDVLVQLVYDVTLINKKNTKETRFKEFSTDIGLNFRKIYYLAISTLYYENQANFFETLTIDLMSSNPKIPFSNIEFTCKTLNWDLKEIKEEMKYLLASIIPLVRVEGTNYAPFLASPELYKEYQDYNAKLWEAYENTEVKDLAEYGDDLRRAGEKVQKPKQPLPNDSYDYAHYFMPIGTQEDKNNGLLIGFRYEPRFDIALRARPSSNGKLQSRFIKGEEQYLSLLCINTYHFSYDVIYPVIGTITDTKAFGTRGYTFNFAFPIVIIDNMGSRNSAHSKVFESKEHDYGFCNSTRDAETDIRVYGTDEDGFSGTELDDINISVQCFSYICPIGKTKLDGKAYRLLARLPESCTNPYLIAEKPGYKKAKQQFTDEQLESTVIIDIKKMKKLPYRVMKHKYNSIDKTLLQAEPLGKNSNVTIFLYSRITGDSQSRIYPYAKDDELNNYIEIPEDGETYDIDLMYVTGEIEKRDLDIAGGYRGNWTISADETYEKEEIVFHVFEYLPAPVYEKDEEEMLKYFIDGNYKELLKPELR